MLDRIETISSSNGFGLIPAKRNWDLIKGGGRGIEGGGVRIDGMHGKRAFRVPRDSCCSATRNSEESRFASGKSRADFPLETRREREKEHCPTRSSRYHECPRWINDPTRNASAINPTRSTPPPFPNEIHAEKREGNETTSVRFFRELSEESSSAVFVFRIYLNENTKSRY